MPGTCSEPFIRTPEEKVAVTQILKCGDATRELSRIVHQNHIDLAILTRADNRI